MAAQATHDLAVKTGEYTDRGSGEVKGRWLKIGTVFQHDDGGTSLKLDCVPVGMPEWNGWVSVFRREAPQAGSSMDHRRRGNGGPPQQTAADFDDDIPF